MHTYYGTNSSTLAQAQHEASSVFLTRVFNWMAVGLGLTGAVAFFTAQSGLAMSIIAGPIFYILIFAELGIVFFLSARIDKFQPGTATGLFLGYSALNGLTLSGIFLAYTNTSISGTFFITASMFAAMAVYGTVTD